MCLSPSALHAPVLHGSMVHGPWSRAAANLRSACAVSNPCVLFTRPMAQLVEQDALCAVDEVAPVRDRCAATLKKCWCIGGGGLGTQQVVVDEVSAFDNADYIKVSKQTKWLCEYVTGLTKSARPSASSTFTHDVHDLMHVVVAQYAQDAQHVSSDALSMGMDDLDDDPVSEDRLERPKTQTKKTIRERRLLAGGVVRLDVPVTPLSEATHSVRVLNATDRECIHLELTQPNLDWLRGYLRAEIVQRAGEDKDGPEKNVSRCAKRPSDSSRPWCWCHSTSCFRLRYYSAEKKKYVVKNFWVSKKSRAEGDLEAKRVEVETFYLENHSQPPAKKPRLDVMQGV